jgi:hypothetical protein
MSYTLTYGQGGLADAAKYLSSKGRGEDTRLIHMTPGEIDALQALAEQHGGSLTINPHTGLPEAGWLGNILKVAAPVALSFIPGVAPLAASIGGAFGATGALASGIGMGLLTGGITTLATGSLKQGLGAGVMGGIMGGLSAPSTAAAQTANIATTSGANAAAQAAALQNTAVNTGLNQAGTSMMTNPSIITAGASPVAQTAASGPLSGASNWWSGLSGKDKFLYGSAGVAGLGVLGDAMGPKYQAPLIDKGSIRPYTYASTTAQPSPYPKGPMYNSLGNPILGQNEQRYLNQGYTELPAYKAAEGGLMAAGGLNNMYPQSQQYANDYALSTSTPMGNEVLDSGYEQRVNQYTGEPIGYAYGGMADLGDYSDGGRLLKGPGDGVSDSIPASIGGKQPARLADGEFVIPARIVSELGNGSTDAGAKRLYAMMDNIQAGRKKTVGKGKVAVDSKAAKHLPR